MDREEKETRRDASHERDIDFYVWSARHRPHGWVSTVLVEKKGEQVAMTDTYHFRGGPNVTGSINPTRLQVRRASQNAFSDCIRVWDRQWQTSAQLGRFGEIQPHAKGIERS